MKEGERRNLTVSQHVVEKILILEGIFKAFCDLLFKLD